MQDRVDSGKESAQPESAAPVQAAPAPLRGAALRSQLGAQARLEVGAADDPAEREADALAAQVVRRIALNDDVESSRVAPGPTAVQRQSVAPVSRIRRRAAIGAEGGELDADSERMLSAARRGGRPLESRINRAMSAELGADLSGVRVHEGGAASELNQRIQAKAFTVGSDIFMRRSLDAESTSGRELLAHELVHVVQQGQAPQIRRAPEPGPDDAEVVTEADLGDAGTDVVTEGTVPDSVPEDDPALVKGPYDRARPKARSTTSSSPGRHSVPVNISLGGYSAQSSHDPAAAAHGAKDAVASGTTVSWKNPGGKRVDAFGEESFAASYSKVKWTQDEAANSPINIDFNLKVKCAWGVKSDGQKDVKSGTAGVVKADNYQDIVADLTPELEEQSWRAPRSDYWSKAICARHEKFHSTDDRDWAEGPGKTLLLAYLDGETIDLTDKERKSKRAVTKKVKALLDEGIDTLENANFDFYTGGAGSYCSYAGEIRAFGDGKQPYLDLAAAVKTQGEALVAKQEAKQQAKEAKQQAKKAKKAGKGATAPVEAPTG